MNGTTSHKWMMGICGLAAAGLFAAAQGCSSSSTPTGTGGTTGTAGATGQGGHTTGTGGTTAGTGGAGVDAGPPCTVLASSAGALSDFMDASANPVGTPYAGAQTGLTTPTFATSSGSLVLTFNTGMATMMYPYAYVGLPLNACVNAAAFTGVKFNVSGTLSAGCTIQFSTLDKGHNTIANGGTCAAANCYPSAKIFTLPATATDVTVNFADQTGGGADPGAPVVDPTHITGVQWQVNPVGPMSGDAGSSCTGTVTIDNITFI
jgi:hypothetical protein